MHVSEIFRSLQGECLQQGKPAVFVRFAGCNLCCPSCDTKYAQSQEGAVEMTPSAIVDRVRVLELKPEEVCLTGGEPLLQSRSEMQELLRSLVLANVAHISVETNGSRALGWLRELRERASVPLSLVVDYKSPSSGASRSMIQDSFVFLSPQDVIKFVCDTEEDLDAAYDVLRNLARSATKPVVYFHSVDGQHNRMVASFVLKMYETFSGRFDIRFGIQLHRLLWGTARGR